MAPNDVPAPPAEPVAKASDERTALADYKTQGKTHVKAKRGYVGTPSDQSLPLIDEVGIDMTSAQADALMDELGRYLIRTDSKE